MVSRRSIGRSLLAVCLVPLLVAACGPEGQPTPTPTRDPSASPVIVTGDEFCRAIDALEGELMGLRAIRLRPANRRALDDRFDALVLALAEVQRIAPRGMRTQLDALERARIELGLGVEDYVTTTRFDEAAQHVYRRELAFGRVLDRLRARTTCPPWAPTPRPTIDPGASPSPPPSPGAGASGSG